MEKAYILNTKNYYRYEFYDDKLRPMVIITPGGGYKYTSERESEPVANKFLEKGYHVCIINYREELNKYPYPGYAIAYVLNKFKQDKRVSKIIGFGFSAGGHAILDVTVHNEMYNVLKPDLLILGYPVITSNNNYWHQGSFENLLLDDFNNQELLNKLSLEKEIKNEPDLFLFSTFTDESVNVYNSLLLLEAYKNNNLNAEYHMYPVGGHGLSLGTYETSNGDAKKINLYYSRWIDEVFKWLDLKLKMEK